LSNIALDGLEKALKSFKGKKVNFVRYADDFIVTGNSKELLEQEVKPIISGFLKERGLTLSEEKTKVTHIEEGIDFLGQNIRKYNGKLLIKPSRKNTKNFLEKVRKVLKKHKTAKQESVIVILNPKIRGWANYHRHVVSKEIFSWVDYQIWTKVWRWCERRHPQKGAGWIKNRYFQRINGRDWTFTTKVEPRTSAKPKRVYLCLASSTPIRRHVKIKAEAHPYDMKYELYFEERHTSKVEGDITVSKGKRSLWKAQGGKCPVCQGNLEMNKWNEHHVIPRLLGGSDNLTNLQLLHPNCHRQLHSQNGRSVTASK